MMVKMLGTHQAKLRTANEPPTVMMIVGLQGSQQDYFVGEIGSVAAQRTGIRRFWFPSTCIVRLRVSSFQSWLAI